VAFFAASAHAATITGEVIDTFCYAHARVAGAPHAACALRCLRAGVPAGLLESATRRVYVLLPSNDATPLPPALIAQAGHRVTIEGDVIATNGTTFLMVKSFSAAP
jgi:hypothetical protein